MIDTIVLRFHGITNRYHNDKLNSHYDLAKYLDKPKEDSEIHYTKAYNLKFIEKLPNEYKVDYIKYGNGELKTFLKAHRAKLEVDSSHYLCTYVINWQRDFIEFNFSIPKFLYGNNVGQFVNTISDKDYFAGVSYKFEHQMEKVYERFISFLRYFSRSLFGEIKIDWYRVELNRIDFCFNQFFKTKEEAFEYLEYQKKLNIVRERTESNALRGGAYNTGISYITKKWSFKIYHKGSEYKGQKGDKKKHEAMNEMYGKQIFDTKELQKLADKILRYEITFRSSRMSEIFRRKIFRKNSQEYKSQLRMYRHISSKTRSGSEFLIPLDKNGNRTKKQEEIVEYRRTCTKEEEKQYISFKKHLQSRNTFYIKCSQETNDHNRKFNNKKYHSNLDAEISTDLFYELIKEFRKMMLQFKVSKKDDITAWEHKINEYNQTLRQKKKPLKTFLKWIANFLQKKKNH